MTRDTGYAPPKWEFDEQITSVFDDMLSRSIPQYEVMRKAVTDITRRFALPDTDIVDLGCALGEGIRPLLDLPNTFLGYESSHAMVEEASKRFNADTNVVISEYDLRNGFPDVSPSVVLSILTLQFIPIEYRQQLLTQVYDSLQPGGAFILVEKLLGNGGTLDSMMVGLYYDMKKDNGYSQEEIDRKRLSLEGQLVPLTPEMNEAILKGAGFTTVDCFWRWMNFGGWIAIKEG